MANPQMVCKAPPKVLRCSCSHGWQDRRYGAGLRLMNPTNKGNPKDSPEVYRCTVCGTERGK